MEDRMNDKNYYDILGVSEKATLEDITAAKNELAKKYHPDVNIRNGVDTTEQMQETLEAYNVLSDPDKRSEYDWNFTRRRPTMQTFDLHNMEETPEDTDPAFVAYWKASNALYDIIQQSDALFKDKNYSDELTELSEEASQHVALLQSSAIPERYWYPDIMNWLLFTWFQHRNYTTSYLLTLYDEYAKENITTLDKLKLQKNSYLYQHSIKRLIKN